MSELTGPIPEAVEVSYNASDINAGDDIDVMLMGPDIRALQAAADDVKTELRNYAGVYGISDSFMEGKEEVQLGSSPRPRYSG